MNQKAFYLMGAFFCCQFIIACCTDVRDFIDFTKIELEVQEQAIITNDSLSIMVNSTDYRVVASLFSNLGFNKTMAVSCDEGKLGMKFPVQSVAITSNNDFDAQHLAGSPLNDLFKQFTYDRAASKFTLQTITAEGFMDNGHTELKLYTAPILAKTHQFTLTFSKSDGAVVTATTDLIEWE